MAKCGKMKQADYVKLYEYMCDLCAILIPGLFDLDVVLVPDLCHLCLVLIPGLSLMCNTDSRLM